MPYSGVTSDTSVSTRHDHPSAPILTSSLSATMEAPSLSLWHSPARGCLGRRWTAQAVVPEVWSSGGSSSSKAAPRICRAVPPPGAPEIITDPRQQQQDRRDCACKDSNALGAAWSRHRPLLNEGHLLFGEPFFPPGAGLALAAKTRGSQPRDPDLVGLSMLNKARRHLASLEPKSGVCVLVRCLRICQQMKM